jgi:hypothetical protein
MIIPELEEAAKKFPGFVNSKTWTDDEEDTLKRYYGKVPTALLEKYIPNHSKKSFRTKLNALKKKGKKGVPAPDPKEVPVAPAKKNPTTLVKLRKIAQKSPKKRPEHGNWNKWQIPFSTKTQKKDYERAWKLCRKYGKPYPEALALSQAAGEKTEPKSTPQKPAPKLATDGKRIGTRALKSVKTGRPISCPYCQKEMNSHGMHLHVRKKHPDKYDEWLKTPDRLQHGIHPAPVPVKEVKEIPAAPAPEVTTQSLQSDPAVTAPVPVPAHIPLGAKVKHARGSPICYGIGEVKRVNRQTGEVLVRFENGMDWIKETNLDVVPVEAKT